MQRSHSGPGPLRRRPLARLLCAVVWAALLLGPARVTTTCAAETDQYADRVKVLEQRMERLAKQMETLRQELAEEEARRLRREAQVTELTTRMQEIDSSPLLQGESWVNRFHLGGYGEIHANFGEDGAPDQLDIHRMVLYLGYDFADWIKLHSETELEHAFVSDGDGDLLLEQLYFDFLLSEPFNIRVGRVLTPLGIINKWHEPTSFNGVERPSFAKYIIPTTWSSDGIGAFGRLSPELRYEAYVVGGLDGSEFTTLGGIRGGRIKERPSLNEPAVTGRLDYRPFPAGELPYDQELRLGLSAYYGGIDNGDQGRNPDLSGDIQIYSADFEYSVSDFDFRGVIANTEIDGAREIGGGVAEQIFGWYLEGAYHFMPDSWKEGKMAESDAVVFLRYDDFDTQHEMPGGVARDPAGDRTEWTLGISYFVNPRLVLKADYQVRDDATGDDLDDLFNLGIGWRF